MAKRKGLTDEELLERLDESDGYDETEYSDSVENENWILSEEELEENSNEDEDSMEKLLLYMQQEEDREEAEIGIQEDATKPELMESENLNMPDCTAVPIVVGIYQFE